MKRTWYTLLPLALLFVFILSLAVHAEEATSVEIYVHNHRGREIAVLIDEFDEYYKTTQTQAALIPPGKMSSFTFSPTVYLWQSAHYTYTVTVYDQNDVFTTKLRLTNIVSLFPQHTEWKIVAGHPNMDTELRDDWDLLFPSSIASIKVR